MNDQPADLMPKFRTVRHNHTPDNKRPAEVTDGACLVEIQDYAGNGPSPDAWLSIMLSETYTPAGSTRQQHRQISVTLRGKDRAGIIALLSRNT